MSFWDTLSSFADKVGVRSEGVRREAAQEYEEQYDAYGQPYGYAEQPVYEETVEEDPYYESSYEIGGGGSYVSAGARPRSTPKPKGRGFLGGILDRFRPAQVPDEEPEPATRGSNVIPISGYGQSDEGSFRPPRQGGQAAWEQDDYQDAAPAQAERPARQGTSTMIYLVRRLEDAEDIIGYMLEGGNVIVNMEEIDDSLKQRVLDMVSGAAFALDCTIKRISFRNYFVAPSGEEVVSNIAPARERDTTRDLGRDTGRERDREREREREREPVDDRDYRSGGGRRYEPRY